MEAPEKIYLVQLPNGRFDREWFVNTIHSEDIEYTRTDTFIEKTCKWLQENAGSYLLYPFCEYDKGALLEDFKKAMEDKE